MNLHDFLWHYELANELTEGSVYQYEAAIKSLCRWAGREITLDELSDSLVNKWLRDLSRSKMAPATVKGRRSHLLVLWRSAYRRHGCEHGPREIRPVTVPASAPIAWCRSDVQKIVASCSQLDRSYDRVGLGRRVVWDLLIRLAWDTGARQCDLLCLTRDGIQADGSVVFTQKKTGQWHLARVHSSTIAKIDSSGARRRPFICPWPYSKEHFRHEFREIVDAAGLRGSFKKLRKSSAADVDAAYPGAGARHLGHRSGGRIATDHYIDPRITARHRPMPEEL